MKNLGFAYQPGQGEPIADSAGRVTRVWANYFAKLALVQTSDELRDLYLALAERVGKLEDGQALTIIGRNSVRTVGTGQVEIQLVGDEDAPGNTEYYGTNAAGEKGFHPVADAIEVEVTELTKAVGLDGIITLGLADVPDSGTGTLQAITVDGKGRVTGKRAATITGTAGQIAVANGNASSGLPTISLVDVPDAGGGTLQKTQFDAKGRKTGTGSATTDDLSEGAANLYFTAARASAAAPVQSVNTKTGAVVLGPSDVGAQPASVNLTAWSGIAPASKADDSAVVHKTGVESIGGAKTFNWQVVVNPDPAAPNGTAAIQINDVAGTAARLQSDSIGPFSFIGRRYSGSLSSPTAVADNTEIFSLSCAAYDGASIGGATGIFSFFADGNQTASNHGCYANIRMTPNGSITRGTYYWLRTTAFFAGTDNSQSLGDPSIRWSVVYAGTGTINTSDAREKTSVRPLAPAELAAAAELGREIGVYQWLAMVAEKGDAARQHVGLTVQRAIDVMESHGLDPFAYGFICYDQWDELPEVAGEDGEIVQEARPAGDRYSFRMDELLAFIARGLAHRLDSVEQRLASAGL